MTSTRTAESFAGGDSNGAAPIGINGVVFAMAAFSSGVVLTVSAAFSIGAAGTGGVELERLSALGAVELHDEYNYAIRDIHAHTVEFDRGEGLIRAVGDMENEIYGRLYDTSLKSARDNQVMYEWIVLDINNGEVRASKLIGRVTGG